MKKVKVLEMPGTINRDRTSFGYQFRVDLEDQDYDDTKELTRNEYVKVMVRIEIEDEETKC